ncbi:hypothetical protein, conserved [Eimeria acervulina]|uniref:Uncharacterized protein n=1 Tax=Eimeria acervulina TaxID=5801 RepID=U6GGL4_EIMAC|nr:hypothetical protein, conserved [Eimeria acervulina]CDI79315.1 hypothetical protein, conserved [Eimeria acervulina]
MTRFMVYLLVSFTCYFALLFLLFSTLVDSSSPVSEPPELLWSGSPFISSPVAAVAADEEEEEVGVDARSEDDGAAAETAAASSSSSSSWVESTGSYVSPPGAAAGAGAGTAARGGGAAEEDLSAGCLSAAAAAAAAAAERSTSSGDLRRMCLLAAEHLNALYQRINTEYVVLSPLSASELAAAIDQNLAAILEEEDDIADRVIRRQLPLGSLPVKTLKEAIKQKLLERNKLKKRNITTLPGLLGVQLQHGKLLPLADAVNALANLCDLLLGQSLGLSPLTETEKQQLAEEIEERFAMPAAALSDAAAAATTTAAATAAATAAYEEMVLEAAARTVMDVAGKPSRAASLSHAFSRAAAPLFTVFADSLSPVSLDACITLVKGLFPSLQAHMTTHYRMQSPTKQQERHMGLLLLPLLNAHRSRLRTSAATGAATLAAEEHTLIWTFLEVYAREHQLVAEAVPAAAGAAAVPAAEAVPAAAGAAAEADPAAVVAAAEAVAAAAVAAAEAVAAAPIAAAAAAIEERVGAAKRLKYCGERAAAPAAAAATAAAAAAAVLDIDESAGAANDIE